MRRTLWALLLISGLVSATDGDYQLGLSAYERGDYAAALAQWLPLAERGDPEAQYRVGRLYYYGRGVDQDFVQAGEWYLRAAEGGHARSQSNLGTMYEQGRGFPKNDENAARWYAEAAEQGRPLAQNNLGRMYEEGRGVPRNDTRAVELYEAAAKKGYAEAQYRLGKMYETGRGVPQDSKKAKKWYRKASNNGYQAPSRSPAGAAAASTATADTDETGTTDDGPVTAAETPPGRQTGSLEEAMEAYERGDYRVAAEMWRPLAEAGDPEAQFQLGELYRLGQGVPEDTATAGRWLLDAAEQGHPRAMYHIALLYYRGRGSDWEKDYVRAYAWFTRAAEEDVGDAAWWRDKLGSKMSRREKNRAKEILDGLEQN
jgi:TPR repeat protein